MKKTQVRFEVDITDVVALNLVIRVVTGFIGVLKYLPDVVRVEYFVEEVK